MIRAARGSEPSPRGSPNSFLAVMTLDEDSNGEPAEARTRPALHEQRGTVPFLLRQKSGQSPGRRSNC